MTDYPFIHPSIPYIAELATRGRGKGRGISLSTAGVFLFNDTNIHR